jgi:succinate dehydrogenase flavin-adding protein (antitoxin of CptAB toxin-antitoxin module)
MSTNELKGLQWNARGLTKSRVEEFRTLLNSHDPDLVFLSETHWNKNFQVKFKNYSTLKKDRNDRRGGGVALLI